MSRTSWSHSCNVTRSQQALQSHLLPWHTFSVDFRTNCTELPRFLSTCISMVLKWLWSWNEVKSQKTYGLGTWMAILIFRKEMLHQYQLMLFIHARMMNRKYYLYSSSFCKSTAETFYVGMNLMSTEIKLHLRMGLNLKRSILTQR